MSSWCFGDGYTGQLEAFVKEIWIETNSADTVIANMILHEMYGNLHLNLSLFAVIFGQINDRIKLKSEIHGEQVEQ